MIAFHFGLRQDQPLDCAELYTKLLICLGEYAVKIFVFDDQQSGNETSSIQLFNVQLSVQQSKVQR